MKKSQKQRKSVNSAEASTTRNTANVEREDWRMYKFTIEIPILQGTPIKAIEHLEVLITQDVQETAMKYCQGQLEHGGDLSQLSQRLLLGEAINEVIDLGVYLRTLRTNINLGRP